MNKVKDDLEITMKYANPGYHATEIEKNNITVK